VVNTILKEIPISRFTIQCFDWRVLRYVHEKFENVKTGALIEKNYQIEDALEALEFLPTFWSPEYRLVKKEDVDFLHQFNVLVVPWTVNTKDEMNHLITLGVDGLITDFPNYI
jgi:glycerophosphoryl diester phosphodiesterase